MKKLNIFKMMLAGAAALSLASCEKEFSFDNPFGKDNTGSRTETIGIQIEPMTKVTLSDDATPLFAWEEGDEIAVWTGTTETSGSFQTCTVSSNSIEVSLGEGASRHNYAIYPASVKDDSNYGQTTLNVKLPASYAYSDISGTKTPLPMVAANTGANLVFYNVGGALRLTVKGIPADATGLVIQFPGNKVNGTFAVTNLGSTTPSISTGAPANGEDKITVIFAAGTATEMTLNIPLPTGDYTNVTVTAYNSSDAAILTTTRPFAYTSYRKQGTKRTVSFPSSKTAFRGYEVSTGILERSKVGDNPATYSLTSGEMIMTYDNDGKEIYALPAGCNPFEGATYYNQSSALNKYYNKWLTLRDELGADGNNINATSEKLPAGWRFPSGGGSASYDPSTVWGNILFGAPKSTITVNGETLKKINSTYYTPFAKVAVTLEEGNGYSVAARTYYGIFLIRDGLTIPTGYFSKIGFSNNYTENTITETQFNDLIRMGCLFIPAGGYYDEAYSSWRSSSAEGHYWSNTYNSENTFYFCYFDSSTYSSSLSVAKYNNQSHKRYCLVKLVKPVNP